MKLLLVGDHLNPLRIMAKIAERTGATSVIVNSGTDALAALEAAQPDLIIIDPDLLDFSGYELAKRIRFRETDGSWTPIVFMVPPQSEEALSRGLSAGGDDFLYKPVSEFILLSKLRAMERIVQMRTSLVVLANQLDSANRELRRVSASDGLTGIANRRFFDAMLEREWRRAKRTKSALSLIICDVDHFKQFNDTYGHLAGDDCLRRVAQALATALDRGGDTPARYGGEEFVILLPETPLEGARIVAEKARQAVLALHIPHSGSSYGWVSMSLGIAHMTPAEEDDQDILVSAADHALYQAKDQGRNRVICYDASEATENPA